MSADRQATRRTPTPSPASITSADNSSRDAPTATIGGMWAAANRQATNTTDARSPTAARSRTKRIAMTRSSKNTCTITPTFFVPTGDVVNIDAEGFIQITDRSKDVIKSGGEWISSIDLENIAISHPAIAEAAVIGIKHPKWDERPIVVAVKKPGQEVSRDELLKFYDGKIAKWWTPEDVVFVDELPHTATGKLSKLTLRQQFKDYRF